MPPGRKSKLETDPQLQGRIASMIRAGMYPERAAVAAGVPESTHYLWQQKGRDEQAAIADGKQPRKTWAIYLGYVEMIDQAIAEAEFLALGKISAGGPGWQSHAWILERRFRDRWGAKAPLETPAAQPPAGTNPTTPPATPLDQLGQRREQRGVKKA